MRLRRVAALRVSRSVRYMNMRAARLGDRPKHPTAAPNTTARWPRGLRPAATAALPGFGFRV
jgi:hypothetical protein